MSAVLVGAVLGLVAFRLGFDARRLLRRIW